MDSKRLERIQDLFHAALDRDPGVRGAYLDAACRDDTELRTAVERYLAADAADFALLDQPIGLDPRPALPQTDPSFEGRRTGRYQISHLLGRGGMGAVYLARDERLERQVALKFLSSSLDADDAKDRFLAEARSAAAIDHVNIATVHEIGETERGELFIAMSYYDGETLRQKIARGRMAIDEALDTTIQAARGLAAAHRRGVVHRDIKPANILLTGEGVVKIVDFGVAKMMGQDVTATGVAKGTVAYMSPEQILGEAVDYRTDLWSLGVVLYEMLSGERPFDGDNMAALVYSIVQDEPQPLARYVTGAPSNLQGVLDRMLAKEKSARYADADALLADLEGALAGGVPGARFVDVKTGQTEGVKSRRAVAVLPFENLSPDSENEYFSDGLTEEIIATLAKIPNLRVVPRGSVMSYKGARKTVAEIAGELDVGTVVEGSVRKAGDRVRIVAQALDAVANEHLWSETYDRRLEDIFEIQSDVAAGVCEAVQARLSPEQRAGLSELGTADVDAYDSYLKGRYLWNQRTEASLVSSLDCFNRAVALDPRFAVAHAGLADSYATLGVYGAAPPHEVMVAAKTAAGAALKIDPNLARALTAQACVRAVYDWDWKGAESDFLQALHQEPAYATGHQWYAVNLLVPLRRFEEALGELERATRLEPLSSAIAASRGVLAYFSRDYDRAMEEYESTLNLHPHFGLAYYFIGQCETERGRLDEGLQAFRKAAELTSESSETIAALGHCLAVSGKRAEAEEVLQILQDRSNSCYVSPVLPAQIFTGLGDYASALDELERAVDLRASDLIWLGVRPVFDPIREHTEFKQLLGTIGLQ